MGLAGGSSETATARAVVMDALRDGRAAVLAAEQAVLATGSVGAVHRLRNAWRQLRGGLWLMARLQPSTDLERLRREAGHAARLLADVRGWDVFLETALPDAIADAARQQRQAAITQARIEMRSARFQCLHDDLSGWIDSPDRARPLLARPDPPLADFAAAALARLHRRVLRRGRHFRALDIDQRHRLRLAAKKLRDVVRIFDPVPGLNRKGRRGMRRLTALLDGLGKARDRLAEPVLLARLVLAALPVQPRPGDERALRKAWRAFRKQPPPWFRKSG